MNTLKMKVLLILINKQFGNYLFRSALIWFATGIVGTLIVGIGFQVFDIISTLWAIGLSLAFSSPAIILALPVFYTLPFIENQFARVAFAVAAVVIVCMIIIGVASTFFTESFSFAALMLYPFIPSALVCFFLISGKQILKPQAVKTIITQ
jgi:hypothetical protein